MTVGLGVGLAVGAGFRPAAAAAQAAAVTATARVLPAVGVLPRRVETSPDAGRARSDSWHWAFDDKPGTGLPSLPATTITRRVVRDRRVIELAATGV